jgi:hypothetical protein
MKMTDPKKARRYFEECVKHTMSFGKTREEAEKNERSSLGYFAGYYDHKTRLRVEKLFLCAHPIFGKASKRIPSAEEAFEAGKKMARRKD